MIDAKIEPTSPSPAARYLLYAIGEILLVMIGKPCPVRDEIWAENESMPLLPTVP